MKIYGIQSVVGRWWPSKFMHGDWAILVGDAATWTDKSVAELALIGLKAEKRPGAEYAAVVELCGQP